MSAATVLWNKEQNKVERTCQGDAAVLHKVAREPFCDLFFGVVMKSPGDIF